MERVREARICAVQAFYRYLDRTIPGVRRRIRQFRPLARVRNWYGPGPFCGALKLRSCPSTSQFPWIQRGSWGYVLLSGLLLVRWACGSVLEHPHSFHSLSPGPVYPVPSPVFFLPILSGPLL